MTASDSSQIHQYYDNNGNPSSNPYVVTGCHIGEQLDPVQVNIDIVFSKEKNENGAATGVLTVYWATYSDVQKGYKGTAVTADLGDENLSDISANYDAFKKAIQPYGNTEVNLNATVRYN